MVPRASPQKPTTLIHHWGTQAIRCWFCYISSLSSQLRFRQFAYHPFLDCKSFGLVSRRIANYFSILKYFGFTYDLASMFFRPFIFPRLVTFIKWYTLVLVQVKSLIMFFFAFESCDRVHQCHLISVFDIPYFHISLFCSDMLGS